MTNKRKALLAVAVAALLTVPGVALASGAFDGGSHAATVEEVTTTIGQSAGTDISADTAGDPADDSSASLTDDLNEAAEAEDSLGGADDVAEIEDTSEDANEAAEAEHSTAGPDDQSDDQAGGLIDDGVPDFDAAPAGIHG